MKESEITKEIIKELNKQGCIVWKHWSGAFSRKGISDILGLTSRGRFLAIEVKNGSRYGLTTHQEKFLNEIREAGGIAMVAFGVQDCLDKLKEYLDSEKK